MPRTKRFKLTPDQTQDARRKIEAWMARQGYDEASLAGLLGVKPETVKVNLGRASYQTQRGLSDDFIIKVQRATGLQLMGETTPVAPPPKPPIVLLAAEQVVHFLSRSVIATASQLALLSHLNRSQFNRLAQTLVTQGLVERARESAPPSGLARSRQYIYGLSAAGRKGAQKLLGRTPQTAFSKGRLRATLFVTHDLLVTEAALGLTLRLGSQLTDWFTAADCRDEFKSPQGRAAVEPDLVFLTQRPNGSGCGWLEVETGTGGRRSVEDKVRAIDHYYQSGAFARRWSTNRITIYWLGEDDGHAHRLRDWVGPGRPRVMHKFSSWDWVQSLGIAAPIWLKVNGREARFPLLAGVDEG